MLKKILPLLLALSTSSPFWQGQMTGLSGYRLAAYDELPRTGLPELFRTKEEYDEYVAALNGSTIYCLHARDGALAWQRMVAGAPLTGPAVSDDLVFIVVANGNMGHVVIEPVARSYTPMAGWSPSPPGRPPRGPWSARRQCPQG